MRPHLVGIAGPSCSGKTEVARWLSARTGAPILNLDHYYRDMTGIPLEVRAKTTTPVAAESRRLTTPR